MYRAKISTYDHFTGGLCVRYKNFRCRNAARLYTAVIRMFGVTAEWEERREQRRI